MPRAALLALAILGAACIATTPTRSGQPADIPPEVAKHVPANVEPYFLAFFVAPAEPKAMSFDLFVRHQAYLRRQYEAGVYRLFGPVTDEGRVRGMIVLSAPTAEQARAIVQGDPIAQEGVVAVEVHPAMLPSLRDLRVEYPGRD